MEFLNNKNKIFQKFTLILLVFVMFVSVVSMSFLRNVPHAEALDADDPANIALSAKSIWDITKEASELIVEIAYAKFRKSVLDYMTDEISRWARTAGEGGPMYHIGQDAYEELSDKAEGIFLDQLGAIGDALCSPNWAADIDITLRTPPSFFTKAQCTFEDVGENFNDFINNFNNGGWKAWFTLSERQNNPYGFYLMTLDEKVEREAKEIAGLKEEVLSGGGWLSEKVCLRATRAVKTSTGKVQYEEAFPPTKKGVNAKDVPTGFECVEWEVVTPGKMMGDLVNKSVETNRDWLLSNREFATILSVAFDSLINGVISKGFRDLTSRDISGKSGSGISAFDIVFDEPPVTEWRQLDPWRIAIDIVYTGSQMTDDPNTVDILYTLDGTNPKQRPGKSTHKYNGFISVPPVDENFPVMLKWLSVNEDGYIEKEAVTIATITENCILMETKRANGQEAERPQVVIGTKISPEGVEELLTAPGSWCDSDEVRPVGEKIPLDEKFTILENNSEDQGQGWYKIALGKKAVVGWVNEQYADIVDGKVIIREDVPTFIQEKAGTGSGLNLKIGAKETAQDINYKVYGGEVYEYEKRTTDVTQLVDNIWYRISLNSGWIDSDFATEEYKTITFGGKPEVRPGFSDKNPEFAKWPATDPLSSAIFFVDKFKTKVAILANKKDAEIYWAAGLKAGDASYAYNKCQDTIEIEDKNGNVVDKYGCERHKFNSYIKAIPLEAIDMGSLSGSSEAGDKLKDLFGGGVLRWFAKDGAEKELQSTVEMYSTGNMMRKDDIVGPERENDYRGLITEWPIAFTPGITSLPYVDLPAPIAVLGMLSSDEINNKTSLEISGAPSTSGDLISKIVKYEWDLDGDKDPDWWVVDSNKDGVFDQYGCSYFEAVDSISKTVKTEFSPFVCDISYSKAVLGLLVESEGLSDPSKVKVKYDYDFSQTVDTVKPVDINLKVVNTYGAESEVANVVIKIKK